MSFSSHVYNENHIIFSFLFFIELLLSCLKLNREEGTLLSLPNIYTVTIAKSYNAKVSSKIERKAAKLNSSKKRKHPIILQLGKTEEGKGHTNLKLHSLPVSHHGNKKPNPIIAFGLWRWEPQGVPSKKTDQPVVDN